MGGCAQDPDPAAGVLDDRQHVQMHARHGDRLEEIAGKHGVGLGAEKVSPGGGGAPGRRVNPGRTPRQAARGRERPYLEAMLRQFEYEADFLAVDGKTGIDTVWLREQLGMPSDLAD